LAVKNCYLARLLTTYAYKYRLQLGVWLYACGRNSHPSSCQLSSSCQQEINAIYSFIFANLL